MVGVATKLDIADSEADDVSQVAALLAGRSSLDGGGIFLTKPNGQREFAELPPKALAALEAVLDRLARSREVLLLHDEAELTPEEAGKILGLSRPLVYQRMDDCRLPFRTVGTHRRVLLRDVLALRPSEEKRRRAARDLAEDTDDIEAAYASSPEGSHRR